jgi:hypothetical protein
VSPPFDFGRGDGFSTLTIQEDPPRDYPAAFVVAGLTPGAQPVAGPLVARELGRILRLYATISLAAGVSLFSLARRMGTSVDMIDRTYGHLAPDAEVYERALLDQYDAKTEAFGAERASSAANSGYAEACNPC